MSPTLYREIAEFNSAIRVPLAVKSDLFHIFRADEAWEGGFLEKMSLYRNGFYEIDLTVGDEQINCAVAGNLYQPRGNYLFFVSPYLVQSYEFLGAARNTRCYMLYFKPEFLGTTLLSQGFPFLEPRPQPVYPLSDARVPLFEDLFEKMLHEYRNNAAGGLEIIRAYLQILLHQSLRLHNETQPADIITEPPVSRAAEITRRFKALLQSGLAHEKDLSLQDYAEQLNVTPKHLSESVKETLGQTATDLIQEKRLLEAKALLAQTDLSAAEIAWRLAFEDPSNFNRFFKRHTGLTPMAFRQRQAA
jgi:AraC-like DNA-binding protein